MRRRNHLLALLLLMSPLMHLPVQAEQLYRFENKDGIPTLSKTLPPWAVRQGYDILDGNSMRLLESIPPEPTAEMRERYRQQQADEEQAAREADRLAEEAQRLRMQQHRRDQTLLLTYESETALLEARDHDLTYRQKALADLLKKQDTLKQRLFTLQNRAADQELKAQTINAALQQKLDNARRQLMFNRNSVSTLQAQLDQLNTQYETDIKRYRELQSDN